MRRFNQAQEREHTSRSLVTQPEYYSFVVLSFKLSYRSHMC